MSPYYYPSVGGVEAVVRYVSEELVNRGHEVTVITSNRSHKGAPPLNRPTVETLNGVRVERHQSILSLGHMSFCPGQFYTLRKTDFDVIQVHVHRHPHVNLALWARGKRSVPIILHGHGPFFSRRFLGQVKARIYNLYDWIAKRALFERLDKIIALTEFEKMRYVKLGADVDKIVVIPNAASDDCFEPVDPTPLIKKYDLSGKRLMLYLSILSKFKRPDLLIQALAQVLKKVPDAFLLLVGPDEGMIDSIRQMARQLGVENHYKWIGRLQGIEKHQALEAGEFLLLPSDEEPFGLVILEAMAHARPVVGSDTIGPRELIRHGETGFVVNRGSVGQIADAATTLLTDFALRTRMGNRGRAVVQNKYRVSTITDKLEELYFQLMSKAKSGDQVANENDSELRTNIASSL